LAVAPALRRERAQAASEAVDVRDAERELRVAKHAGRLDPLDRTAEGQPDASFAVGRERQAFDRSNRDAPGLRSSETRTGP
jgi:hypothetical protein